MAKRKFKCIKYALFSGKKIVDIYPTKERAEIWKRRLSGSRDFPSISKNLRIKKIKRC